MPLYPLAPAGLADGIVRTATQALFFLGIVVNPVPIGHFTSLASLQNGHVTPCGASFALLNGPETVNVFLHDVQVMIFSIYASQPVVAFPVPAFSAALEASWPQS